MPRRDYLGIHVVGCGIGECIILELPNSPPAVVDCGNVEVVDYVVSFVKREIGWDRLSFVAVTHPHLDHFEGLSNIVDAFPGNCGALWVFAGFFHGHSVNQFLKWAELTNTAADFDRNFFCDAVRREWTRLSEFADEHRILPRVMRSGGPRITAGNLEIGCILPCGEVADTFDRDLSACAPSREWLQSFAAGTTLDLPAPPGANDVSSVLSVVWGKTRLLLCGDCEAPSWNIWTDTGGTLAAEVHGLKIGHHGSLNGVFPGLLGCIGPKTFAIVTPFRRGRNPLPDVRAMKLYGTRCGFVRSTASNSPETVEDLEQDAPVALRALGAALDDPTGQAAQILKLHGRTRQQDNVVGVLFDSQGNAVDHYWSKGTVQIRSFG